MAEPIVNRAYLALGSNIRPEDNLPAAARKLTRHGRVLAVSRVWEFPPVGDTAQANYLNTAVLLETPLSAGELRHGPIAEIERTLHRIRDPKNKNAPRTIDIDIVLFNREILRIGHRQIPDPEILKRAFIAIPLSEIDPGYLHPEHGVTLKEIAQALQASAATMKLRPDVLLLDGTF